MTGAHERHTPATMGGGVVRAGAMGAGVILGLGSDLCDIRRVEAVMARFGERFLLRVFTETERARAGARTERLRAPTFAKRFAAKEACSKALGTGFRAGVFHSDLGVANLPSGQPTLRLTGGALARLRAITPAGMRPVIHLTMTDEYPYAFAEVVISAVPEDAFAGTTQEGRGQARADAAHGDATGGPGGALGRAASSVVRGVP